MNIKELGIVIYDNKPYGVISSTIDKTEGEYVFGEARCVLMNYGWGMHTRYNRIEKWEHNNEVSFKYHKYCYINTQDGPIYYFGSTYNRAKASVKKEIKRRMFIRMGLKKPGWKDEYLVN